jgi:hypothetical protein
MSTASVEGNTSGDISYAQFLALPEKDKASFKQSNPEKFRKFLGIT